MLWVSSENTLLFRKCHCTGLSYTNLPIGILYCHRFGARGDNENVVIRYFLCISFSENNAFFLYYRLLYEGKQELILLDATVPTTVAKIDIICSFW